MKRPAFVVAYALLMALAPVFLAVNQGVPAGSGYKQVVLLLSLASFGLVLAQFWLSRLWPRRILDVEPAVVFRWHKAVGYSACGFLLIHPGLMIARRIWVLESDPMENLLLMLRAPAMLPAVVGWVAMVVLVVLSFTRRRFRPRFWRRLHGLLSVAFVATATWHVVVVGRHSNAAMSFWWVAHAGWVIAMFLYSYIPVRSPADTKIIKGVVHEFPR